ncbi:MAG TPA: pyrroline-5-carboxylate reductase [Candidatus Hydrogenedentes bacterium]|nr:pyrroline-5-carboxylate reductase [Candidatus Hydrogenedentota bacterium]HQE84399.1 pyrroline-5-carboxylate reductase [Candidatus Hydrogenedentota bacterium]HQH54709.1 pyrroline-5-carboxylate reductase [Candidatus Hydrogenedentota bacterium]HQM47539.1 pyrroline-5-carboxylate reductase [Candidatus Hydrogenedentota bacterium]
MAVEMRLGFLGFGNMGRAIAGGLIERQTMRPGQLATFDVDEAKRAAAQAMGMKAVSSAESLAEACDALMVAVKPQNAAEALEPLAGKLAPSALVISICAGLSTAFFQERLGSGRRVIRVMPNTPALVGAGAAAVAPGKNCVQEDIDFAKAIFESVGLVQIVPESAMDAVTALSGSGPAYFFYMVECLVRAAQEEGLTEEQATELAKQTALGAGRLLLESGESAGVLRQRVTSKGGTTEAALRAFKEHGFEEAIRAGVAAAAARSRELGR